jgi:hypothetical protein
MRTTRTTALVVLATAALAACGGSATAPVAPEPDVPDAVATTGELASILASALQDEYHAEAVYLRVLADHGTIMPFANIVNAEARHAASILSLYAARGWTPPANAWSPAAVDGFAAVTEACTVGAAAERADIALYDELLARGDLPADVQRVFENNRRASLEGHLPAFERCGG